MVRKSVAEIIQDHVDLELEGIDRMYLNGYVPSLQTGAGFAYFLRSQLHSCRKHFGGDCGSPVFHGLRAV